MKEYIIRNDGRNIQKDSVQDINFVVYVVKAGTMKFSFTIKCCTQDTLSLIHI